jgi:hypothetical protein
MFETVEKPFLDGILNVGLFGFPSYMWLIAGVGLLITILHVGIWAAYWRPQGCLKGIHYAFSSATKAVFTGDLHNRYSLVEESKAKLVHPPSEYAALYYQFFKEHYDDVEAVIKGILGRLLKKDYSMHIAKHLEKDYLTDKRLCSIGPVEASLIIDCQDWLYPDNAQKREIKRLVDAWNEANPNDEIFSISKFQTYLQAGHFDGAYNEKLIKKYTFIQWQRINQALPSFEKTSDSLGFDLTRAREMDEEKEKSLDGFIPLIIVMTIVMAILIFAANVWFRKG